MSAPSLSWQNDRVYVIEGKKTTCFFSLPPLSSLSLLSTSRTAAWNACRERDIYIYIYTETETAHLIL